LARVMARWVLVLEVFRAAGGANKGLLACLGVRTARKGAIPARGVEVKMEIIQEVLGIQRVSTGRERMAVKQEEMGQAMQGPGRAGEVRVVMLEAPSVVLVAATGEVNAEAMVSGARGVAGGEAMLPTASLGQVAAGNRMRRQPWPPKCT